MSLNTFFWSILGHNTPPVIQLSHGASTRPSCRTSNDLVGRIGMIGTFLFLSFVAATSSADAQTFSSGSGTVEDPYVITNWNELNAMRTALDQHFVLGNSLDLSGAGSIGYSTHGSLSANDGLGWAPIGSNAAPFVGSFDGRGHYIEKLRINRPSETNVGLFGYVSTGLVTNVGLVDVDVVGETEVGALIGMLVGDASGSAVLYGEVSNAYATGAVSGQSTVGGLVGYNTTYGQVKTSYSSATVEASSGSAPVTAGGLVGANAGLIQDTYALGAVNGSPAGGLVGDNAANKSGKIETSYSTGKVGPPLTQFMGRSTPMAMAPIVNGLVGIYGTVENSYWDGDTATVSAAHATGATLIRSSTNTIDAYSAATYTGFDFTNTWYIAEGYTRPFLRMQHSLELASVDQVQLMVLDLDATYQVLDNIDFSGVLSDQAQMWAGTGSNLNADFQGSFVPVGGLGLSNSLSGPFTGEFYGDFWLMSHVVIDPLSPDSSIEWTDPVGFFGVVEANTTDGVVIEGVNFRGSVSQADTFAPMGFIGQTQSENAPSHTVSVSDTIVEITLSGEYSIMGGLIGRAGAGGEVRSSYVEGAISSIDPVRASSGGLIGEVDVFFGDSAPLVISETFADVDQTYNLANLLSGNSGIGGLIGRLKNTQDGAVVVRDNYAIGSITLNTAYDDLAPGGLIGVMDANSVVVNTYAAVAMSAGDAVAGGLIGVGSDLTNTTSSFWDTTVSGTTTSQAGVGLISRKLREVETFTTNLGTAAWDFDDVWEIGGSDFFSYPFFQNVGGATRPGKIDAPFPKGTGIAEDPYQIFDWNDLSRVREHLDAFFLMANSLDAETEGYANQIGSISALANGGTGWKPIGDDDSGTDWQNYTKPFTGQFDGNDQTIDGLIISNGGVLSGLFAITDGALIKDLSLTNVNISGSNEVGGLVGVAADSSIENVSIQGTVTGSSTHVGGLVGRMTAGSKIDSSSAIATVTGLEIVGGLVGVMNTNDISIGIQQSSATGAVIASTTIGTRARAGGLVGQLEKGLIENSYATADVTGNTDQVGGLVGRLEGVSNAASIKRSYALGEISGRGEVGGLIGAMQGGTIQESFAAGDVTGQTGVGGLLGSFITGPMDGGQVRIFGAYAQGDVNGTDKVGGLIGDSGSAPSQFNNMAAQTYATGAVSATGNNASVGGLVGAGSFIVNDSVWNEETTGVSTSVGSVNTTASTELAMKSLGTFEALGWNFDATQGVWAINPTGYRSYPYFVGIDYDAPLQSPASNPIPGLGALAALFDAGDGSEDAPFEITSWQELANMGLALSGGSDRATSGGYYFRLKSDLNALSPGFDAYASALANNGMGWLPIGTTTNRFTGRINGNNHTVADWVIASDQSSQGLFGAASNVRVESLTLARVDIETTGSDVGLLFGSVRDGVYIWDVTAEGTVTGQSQVGGLVGQIESTLCNLDRSYLIAESRVNVNVTGQNNTNTASDVGGVLGLAGCNMITISQVASLGDVTGSIAVGGVLGRSSVSISINRSQASGAITAFAGPAGGLAGQFIGQLARSYATGEVVIDSGGVAGGLIGKLSNPSGGSLTVINRSYAQGNVTAESEVGGLVGESAAESRILESYASGRVEATEADWVAGGFLGSVGADVINSFWNTDTASVSLGTGYSTAAMPAQGHSARMVARVLPTDPAGLVGLSDLAMQSPASYIDLWSSFADGYSFISDWGVCAYANDGYPFFSWQFDADVCSIAQFVLTTQPANGLYQNATFELGIEAQTILGVTRPVFDEPVAIALTSQVAGDAVAGEFFQAGTALSQAAIEIPVGTATVAVEGLAYSGVSVVNASNDIDFIATATVNDETVTGSLPVSVRGTAIELSATPTTPIQVGQPYAFVATFEGLDGAPLAGQVLNFVTTKGTFGDSLNSTVQSIDVVTNSDGEAQVSLNHTSPDQSVVTVTCPDACVSDSTVEFLVGDPAKIEIVAGNLSVASVNAPLSVNPLVVVTDAFDNPISGLVLSAQASGGVLQSTSVSTDESGQASVSWTMGSVSGIYELTIGTSGLDARFTATATAVIPAAPVDVSVQSVPGGFMVEWSEPPFDGGDVITAYQVLVNGEVMCEVAATEPLRCELSNLDSELDYAIDVVAINSAGVSVASSVSDQKAQPVLPIPTLSWWAILMLMLLLGWVAHRAQRRYAMS